MGQISDKLITDCQQGNRQAQRALYEQLAPKMYAVCLRYTRCQADADDCLQDAFVKVFTRIADFRHEGVFEGWVRRIVVNTVIEKFRKKAPESREEPLENLTDDPVFEDNDFGGFNHQYLLDLVREMPQQYQMVFSMYAIDGYSHEDIAKEMEISVGTSKSNLSRGRKWLQKRLEETKNKELKLHTAHASGR